MFHEESSMISSISIQFISDFVTRLKKKNLTFSFYQPGLSTLYIFCNLCINTLVTNVYVFYFI